MLALLCKKLKGILLVFGNERRNPGAATAGGEAEFLHGHRRLHLAGHVGGWGLPHPLAVIQLECHYVVHDQLNEDRESEVFFNMVESAFLCWLGIAILWDDNSFGYSLILYMTQI